MSPFDLIIQWVILFGVAAVLAMRGQLTPFHPTSFYLLFHTIVFCIRPTLIHAFDFDNVWDYMLFTPAPEHLELALLLSSTALVVFCLAFCLTCPHSRPARNSEGFRDLTDDERKSFYWTALIFVPLGLYSILAANVEGERVGGVYIMTGSTGYLNDLQQVFVSITVLSVLVLRWKWYSFIPLLVFIYFRASAGWGRWTIIIPIIALILFYLWQHRRIFPSWKLLIPVPFIFILFANLTHDRMYFRKLIEGQTTEGVTITDTSWNLQKRFDTLDFANFDFLTYIVAKVPEETGRYSNGVQHLQLFTEPIPRKFWPGKPVGAPVRYFDLNNYGNFLGLTTSLPGDGWITGGWLGAIATMAIAGIALGVFTNWFFINQENLFRVSIFLIVNALLIQLFRDGSLVAMAKFLLFTLMPIFVWHWISAIIAYRRIRKEERSQEEGTAPPSSIARRPRLERGS